MYTKSSLLSLIKEKERVYKVLSHIERWDKGEILKPADRSEIDKLENRLENRESERKENVFSSSR